MRILCWQKLYALLVGPVNVSEALGLFHALEWLTYMQCDNIDFVLNSKMIDVFHSIIVGMQKLRSLAISSQVEFN